SKRPPKASLPSVSRCKAPRLRALIGPPEGGTPTALEGGTSPTGEGNFEALNRSCGDGAVGPNSNGEPSDLDGLIQPASMTNIGPPMFVTELEERAVAADPVESLNRCVASGGQDLTSGRKTNSQTGPWELVWGADIQDRPQKNERPSSR